MESQVTREVPPVASDLPNADRDHPEGSSIRALRRRSENARRAAHIRHDREGRIREALRAVAGAQDEGAHLWSRETQALEISDEKIRAIAPKGYNPTEAQIRFVRAHVYAAPRASFREICEEAQVPVNTARSWLRRHPGLNRMIEAATLAAAGMSVPRVWRAVLARALGGDPRAAEMYLRRFDPVYRAIRAGRPPEADETNDLPSDWHIQVAKARKALREGARAAEEFSQKESDIV